MKNVTFLFNTKLILFIVIILAILLRFFQLGTNPPSLTWDEASWGYNAYSLGLYGKDEFGRFLPYDYLESFGDFKPPMYAYLTILPVKVFGLTEFATRTPSAFFGTLTVFLTYFLVKKLFYKSEKKEWYALSSAGILAISPWHIMLSRAAFEANVATFFIVLGFFAFLKSIRENSWYLLIAAVSFVLSLYTFNTARIVSPIIVIILSIVFWKELFRNKRQTFLAVCLGIILFLPIVPFLLSPQANLRFREVNIFSDISVIKRTNQEIANDKNEFWSKVIHNRRFAYAVEYLKHYFDHFSPSFLFIKGDGNPKFSTQDVGQLYIWELPFLIGGMLLLFNRREGFWWLIPIWLLISIIPSATARETPHALRIESSLPTFQVFVGYGLVNFFFYLKKLRVVSLFLFLIIVVLNLFYFLHGYYMHYPHEYSREWQYGYKDSITYVKRMKEKYNKIYITTELGRPYIYYLFYTKTLPGDFRKTARITRDAFGFVTVKQFDRYVFLSDVNREDEKGLNALYIASPGHVPKQAKILHKFQLVNNEDALIAYTFD